MTDTPSSARNRAMNCLNCAYDLTGTVNEKCPECGAIVGSEADRRKIIAYRRLFPVVVMLAFCPVMTVVLWWSISLIFPAIQILFFLFLIYMCPFLSMIGCGLLVIVLFRKWARGSPTQEIEFGPVLQILILMLTIVLLIMQYVLAVETIDGLNWICEFPPMFEDP